MLSNVPLASLTTLRLGGPATRLVDIDREGDIPLIFGEAAFRGESLFILGGGSNVVVADEGFPGLVVRIALRGVDVQKNGSRAVVDAFAGESWDTFVARAVAEGFSGVECLSGIPGWVGATPIQNVGAYGQEVKDTLAEVHVFDRMSGRAMTMEPAACAFGYRTSLFKGRDRFVITKVRFALERRSDSAPVRYPELARALSIREGERAPLGIVRETILALRRGKGMVLDPDDTESVSAGSFFVNPVVTPEQFAAIEARAGERPPAFDAGIGLLKVPAAWLVERAGFPKGWSHGRVGVSRKHALSLVNRGSATTRELLTAARMIRDAVQARFGVTLEPEPVFVGCSFNG